MNQPKGFLPVIVAVGLLTFAAAAGAADEPTKRTRSGSSPGLFLARIKVPVVKDADGASADKGFLPHGLYLHPSGTRLVAGSQRETYCIDVATGKVLQTFRNETSAKKAAPQFIAASSDARVVVVPSDDRQELALRDAATGRAIGAHRLPKMSQLGGLLWESRSPNFTPAGDYLLVGAGAGYALALYAISTRTGSVKGIDLSRFDTDKLSFNHPVAIPQRSTFIVESTLSGNRKGHASGLFALDLATGKATPLSSLRIRPESKHDRGLVLSPDGNCLLVKGQHELEVCDWRADHLLFHHDGGKFDRYHDAQFTPDGKRFVVFRRVNLIEYESDPTKPGTWVGHGIDNEVFLFDIASQKRIGSFRPAAHGLGQDILALAMGHDGKSFAVWTGSEVTLVDFQAAFGVAPLPPGRRLEGPEQLPLKELSEIGESRRSVKMPTKEELRQKSKERSEAMQKRMKERSEAREQRRKEKQDNK